MSDIKPRGGKLIFKGDKPKKRKRKERTAEDEKEDEGDPQCTLGFNIQLLVHSVNRLITDLGRRSLGTT